MAESKRRGKEKLFNYYDQELRSKLTSGNMGDSPRFKDGSDKDLTDFSISDSWNRVHLGLSCGLSYRRTDMEMKEMCEILKIQEMMKWEDIKSDPEAVEFYESAFKEMSMKFVSMVYANVRRVVNSVGLKVLFMHPIDLNTQMTTQLRSEFMGAIIAANIDTESNMPKIKKLFAQNNMDQFYDFNDEDFVELAAISDMAPWKTVNVGQGISTFLATPQAVIDEMDLADDKADLLKAVFGDKNADKTAEKEFDEYKKQKNNDKLLKEVEPHEYYLHTHPTVFSQKTYMTKTESGEFLFGKNLQTCTSTMFTDTAFGDVKKIIDNRKLAPLDRREMEAYEKSVKDRNLPKIFSPEDPYGFESYKQGYKNMIKKDKNGQPIIKDGKLQFKSLMDLPEWSSATG